MLPERLRKLRNSINSLLVISLFTVFIEEGSTQNVYQPQLNSQQFIAGDSSLFPHQISTGSISSNILTFLAAGSSKISLVRADFSTGTYLRQVDKVESYCTSPNRRIYVTISVHSRNVILRAFDRLLHNVSPLMHLEFRSKVYST
mgnify:CR=1 FL=1|jgi:hypothetical protein